MLTPGTILNHKYKIIRRLGQGGFAYTYEALQEPILLQVCIKEIPFSRPDAGSGSPADFQDGIREGQILGSLHNAHIVRVLDYFEENNCSYIVLEYLEGLTLQDYVREKGPIPARQLFSSVKPLLSALSQLHAKGLIHRDIAPDNLMVMEDEKGQKVSCQDSLLQLKLFDFGTARKLGLSEYTCTMKEGYSPIEQLTSDEKQGAFTDLYALSAVLYYCLTGRKPEAAYSRLLDDDLQKPSVLGISIDSRLEAILIKGLAIRPEDRYQSADEMLQAIEEAMPDHAEKKKEQSSSREKENEKEKSRKLPALHKRRLLGICTAFSVLILTLFSSFYFYKGNGKLHYDPDRMYKVTLTPTDDFTVAGYNESIRILKERLELFSKDSGSYSLEEKDGVITLLLNKEDFPQNTASGDSYKSFSYDQQALPEYLLRAYLSRAASLTLSPSLTSDESLPLVQNQDFTVTAVDESALASLEDTLLSDTNTSLQEEAGTSPKILSLQFTADFLKENASILEEWKNSYTLIQDKDCSPPVSPFTAIPKEDGSGFYLVFADEEDKLFELLQYNLTHEPLEHSFDIAIEEQSSWQEDSSSFGENQVKEKRLSSAEDRASYYIKAMMSDGEMLDCIEVLQKRLDTLGSSYAIGQMDSLTAVTPGCDASVYRFLSIMGNDKLQYSDIADLVLCGNHFYLSTGTSSNGTDNYSDTITSCYLDKDGISLRNYGFAEKLNASDNEKKGEKLYLLANINSYDTLPLMTGTLQEDGSFLFTTFANGEKMTSENRWVAELISACIENQPPVTLSAYHAYSSKETEDSSGDTGSTGDTLGLFEIK